MVRIERLLGDLTTREPVEELETADPRLEEAAAATSRGDYPKAAEVAEAVYETGAFDARLLGCLLYAALLERGPASLELLLRIALKSVSDNRPAFTPSVRRDVLLDGSLNWFLSTMLRQLDLSDRLRDGTATAWETAAAAGQLDGPLAVAEQLLPLVTALTPRARTPLPLQRLCDRIRALQQQSAELRARQKEAHAAAAAAAAGASPANAPAAKGAAPALAEQSKESPPESAPPAARPPLRAETEESRQPDLLSDSEATESSPSSLLPGFVTRTSIQASAALLQLAREMHLFTTLVERQDLEHAAVVAADIQRTLDRFDPRRYLPALVVPYLRALSRCGDELAQLMQQRDSLRFRTLSQLLQADPDAFMAETEVGAPSRNTPSGDPR